MQRGTMKGFRNNPSNLQSGMMTNYSPNVDNDDQMSDRSASSPDQ